MQMELLHDTDFLLGIFNTMRNGLMIMDVDGNIMFFNSAAEKMTGYGKEEVLGKPCVILDTDSCTLATDKGVLRKCEVFKKRTIYNRRCRIRSKDGQAVHLLKNAVAIKDRDGKDIGIIETMTDITSLYMKEMELEDLKRGFREENWFKGLLGKSHKMKLLYEQIRNAASSDASVLLFGESGTGKTLVARAIHSLSRRKDGPLVEVNCAALNEHLLESELFGHKKGSFTGALQDRMGRFEAADKGSIFLDEIGDMCQAMQAKLLRVLEDKKLERVGENKTIQVDVRIISATNKNLDDLVVRDKFREDLFYRINSILIRVPPLRERKEDIPILAYHYLKKISIANSKEVRSISSEALKLINDYQWPGNIRQFINALEHATVTCKGDRIEYTDLPDFLFAETNEQAGEDADMETCSIKEHMNPTPHHGANNGIGREELLNALKMHNGNKSLAARQLGISRVTLWKKLKKTFGE